MLVVNTPEGQKLMQYQRDALDLFVRRFPKMTYKQTATIGENAKAVIDALFYKENDEGVSFAAEVKSRYITHQKLKTDYDNEWLLSLKKIDQIKILSDLLQIPFWGFLYLRPENTLLYIKIYDPLQKDFTCEMRVEPKTTTGPVIHDTTTELCAFINMKDAYIIYGREQ